MVNSKPYWESRLLNQLQGPSSLGMVLSGSAVGFSASIISPETYVGFWTSVAFQMQVGFQFLSVVFGFAFVFLRLRSNDTTQQLKGAQQEDASAGDIDHLLIQSRRLATITKFTFYAQLGLLFAGVASFIWLMFLYYQRALYP